MGFLKVGDVFYKFITNKVDNYKIESLIIGEVIGINKYKLWEKDYIVGNLWLNLNHKQYEGHYIKELDIEQKQIDKARMLNITCFNDEEYKSLIDEHGHADKDKAREIRDEFIWRAYDNELYIKMGFHPVFDDENVNNLVENIEYLNNNVVFGELMHIHYMYDFISECNDYYVYIVDIPNSDFGIEGAKYFKHLPKIKLDK